MGNCLITCLYYASCILSGPLHLPPFPLPLPGLQHVFCSTAAVTPGPRRCSFGPSTWHPHLASGKFRVPLLPLSPSCWQALAIGTFSVFDVSLDWDLPLSDHSVQCLSAPSLSYFPSSALTHSAGFPAASLQPESSLCSVGSWPVPCNAAFPTFAPGPFARLAISIPIQLWPWPRPAPAFLSLGQAPRCCWRKSPSFADWATRNLIFNLLSVSLGSWWSDLKLACHPNFSHKEKGAFVPKATLGPVQDLDTFPSYLLEASCSKSLVILLGMRPYPSLCVTIFLEPLQHFQASCDSPSSHCSEVSFSSWNVWINRSLCPLFLSQSLLDPGKLGSTPASHWNNSDKVTVSFLVAKTVDSLHPYHSTI